MPEKSFMQLARRRALLVLAIACCGVVAASSQPHAGAQIPAATPAGQTDQDQDPGLQAAAIDAAALEFFPSNDDSAPPKRIFRLTRDQIDATARSLLPGYKLPSIRELMAKDPLQTNYEYAELLTINSANFGALSAWIRDIVAMVHKDPSGVIKCPTGSNGEKCLEAQARSFIIKAFRGDVSPEVLQKTVKFYLAGVQSAGINQATSELVEVVLNSPSFLFRKEVDAPGGRLVAPQALQALAYMVADAPPDALQLEQQDASRILGGPAPRVGTIEEVVAHSEALERLVSRPEAREKLARFFKAWLEINEPGEFRTSQQVFPQFNAQYADRIYKETDQFLKEKLSQPAPTLKDITQPKQPYMRKEFEANYQSKSPDPAGQNQGPLKASQPVRLLSLPAVLASYAGSGPVLLQDPTQVTKLKTSQRLGILSQPAVIASHSGPDSTQPVKRGVFWVRKLMCKEMDPQPTDIDVSQYLQAAATERERIEQATSQAPCASCHKIINPFGFFQESYDALGRWRDREKNGAPINTGISVKIDDEPRTLAGPVEALKAFTSSLQFKQCFVRQVFRFYMGRREEDADDPLLRSLFVEFASNDNQDILKLIQSLASSDRIVRRQ